MADAKKHFRPEFLNRLDDVVVFRSLDRSDIARIAELAVENISKRLTARGCSLELDDAAREVIAAKAFNPEFGAREVRRIVEHVVEDPLAEEILRSGLNGTPYRVAVSASGDELHFNIQPVEQ